MPRTTRERYEAIAAQLSGLITDRADLRSHRATAVALLFAKLPQVSWAGFYLLREGELRVDVYQGPVACLVLPPDRGVCWAAIDRNEPVVVPDVEAFPGHVACDSTSRSEIVVPHRDETGKILGVLDLDSRREGRFGEDDRVGLTRILAVIEAQSRLPGATADRSLG